jgi:predicted NAD-dependent protein-ADP-ribosyltransferase YbiA (DUF1768 family)
MEHSGIIPPTILPSNKVGPVPVAADQDAPKILPAKIHPPIIDLQVQNSSLDLHEIKQTPIKKIVNNYRRGILRKISHGESLHQKAQQAQAALKSTAIFQLVLFSAVTTLAIIAIGVSIAFCPPVGIALVCVGAGFAIVGMGALTVYKMSVAQSQAMRAGENFERVSATVQTLVKYGQLFEEYKNKGDGTSFEELLNQYEPPNDRGFQIEDLKFYASIFEKKSILRFYKENIEIQNKIDELTKQKNKFVLPDDQQPISALDKEIKNLETLIENNREKASKLAYGRPYNVNVLIREIVELEKRIKPKSEDQQPSTKRKIGKKTKDEVEEKKEPPPLPLPLKIEKWIQRHEHSLINTYPIDLSKKDQICLFGTHAQPSNLSDDAQAKLKDNGYSKEYEFLSNSYMPDLMTISIEGKEYPSVTHYLLAKKALKTIGKDADMKRVSAILNAPTIENAMEVAKVRYHVKNFIGMESELKKALFYKFVQEDGKTPTSLGEELLATGDKKLLAGYEIGDKAWGVEFTNADATNMEGANRLGIHLEYIRKYLNKQGVH